MTESEQAWMRNYGFLLEDKEVRDMEKIADPTFTICGTHGELTVRLNDGVVIERNPEDAYREEVVRADVNEWRRTYSDERLQAGSSHDILDFGTWNPQGSYEGPELSWREERAELVKEKRTKQRDAE
jgi:hypothetical protein